MHTLLSLLLLAQAPDVTALSWMAGCWRQESATQIVDEVWMAPARDGMLGMSRTISRGRIVHHEFLQIRVQDGGIVLVAKPARQPEATFTVAAMGGRAVTFENRAHDFPQRVIYRLRDDGVLVGRIEGEQQGTPRSIDFPMRRVACP